MWTTFIHQPDLNADFEAYARYVSTTSYLIDQLYGSILGVPLATFSDAALGAYLSSRRSAPIAMVLASRGTP